MERTDRGVRVGRGVGGGLCVAGAGKARRLEGGIRQANHELTIDTPGQGLHEITGAIVDWVAGTGIATGLLTLFVRHTSASLLVQENAAPAARRDLERWFARIAPEGPGYEHDDEGPDDMPAHIRAALTATSLSIPVACGRPVLGTWQGVYVFEHRRAGSARRVAVHLIGEWEFSP